MIFCADDFGLNSSINNAILDLAKKMKINSISVLINKVDTTSVTALKSLSSNAQIGLHLDLFNASWISLVWNLFFRRGVLRTEIKNQIDLFYSKFGFYPNYIDGHMHCHIYPVISTQVISVLGSYNLKSDFFIRSITMQASLKKTLSFKKIIYLYWLHIINSQFVDKLKKHNISTNNYIWGSFNNHMSVTEIYKIAQTHVNLNDIFFFHPGFSSHDGAINRRLEYDFLCKLKTAKPPHLQL